MISMSMHSKKQQPALRWPMSYLARSNAWVVALCLLAPCAAFTTPAYGAEEPAKPAEAIAELETATLEPSSKALTSAEAEAWAKQAEATRERAAAAAAEENPETKKR